MFALQVMIIVHLSEHLWLKCAQQPDTHSPAESSPLCHLSLAFAASFIDVRVTPDHIILTFFSKIVNNSNHCHHNQHHPRLQRVKNWPD